MRWGNGFSTKAGDTVKFKYVKVDSDWVTTLEKADTSTTAKNSFDLGKCTSGSLLLTVRGVSIDLFDGRI